MKTLSILLFTFPLLFACAQSETNKTNDSIESDTTANSNEDSFDNNFKLENYFSKNQKLETSVEIIFDRMSSHDKVAQLIMPAIGEHGQKESTIDKLVDEGKIGGLLLLNGTKEEFSNWVRKYNIVNDSLGKLPFFYSADAEPSLVNRKIKNSTPVAKANTLKNKNEVINVANTISSDLKEIGINYNFAPVVDMSPNKTVGWRSFGHEPDSVIPWSISFIKETQQSQIIATAKHFPGHGFVEGDTHKKLVYIDGEMKELKNYPPLIENDVMSIMIAHIAIQNNASYNTNNMPATTSKEVVTNLLRDSLNFDGLIVTDAMNMGGVSYIEDADILAISAGCDILLMPLDASKAHAKLLSKYNSDDAFKVKVDSSVKRIVRAKLCLGLIQKIE
ncbi:MAG: glycoside hydrolase family 3 N-terminal domain-containing protein [Brumimicrobium sp.]